MQYCGAGASSLGDDLGFRKRVGVFAVEQFVSQATSLTPVCRIALALVWACETRTSTCLAMMLRGRPALGAHGPSSSADREEDSGN